MSHEPDDVSAPVMLGVVSAAAAIGLFFWRRHALSAFDKMDRATRRQPTTWDGESYMALRGAVACATSFEAEYSKEHTAATKTQLTHRWAERTITIEAGKNGERDRSHYGEWEQKQELVNQPILRGVPISVVHTDRRAAAGDVAVAVRLECEPEALPLVTRFSQSLEENKKSSVTVNNSNNNNATTSGAREVRELGTLREEALLPLDKPLTVFGYVRRDPSGDLAVSDAGCSGEEPFIVTHETPAAVLGQKQSVAFYLLVGECVMGLVALGSVAYVVSKRI